MTYDIIQLRSKKQDKALKITKLSSDREKAVKMATSNVLSTGDFVRFIDVQGCCCREGQRVRILNKESVKWNCIELE